MQDVNKKELAEKVKAAIEQNTFNIYKLTAAY
jgi:hypothetical protein